jgi:hypothetical protein
VLHDVVSRVWPGGTSWMTGGVVPLAVIGTGAFVFLRAVKTRFALTRNETVQTVVVLGGVAFSVLTIVGIWFRGPGMSLVWPWNR